MSCSSNKKRSILSMHYSSPMWPHIGCQSLSPILLFIVVLLKYALQLVAGAFRLLHPGGDSSYPWVSVCALGHNLGKDRTVT